MSFVPPSPRPRRLRPALVLLSGSLAALTGAAHAQTFSTTIVAPTQVQVLQFSTTTTTASPTYNRVAISAGLNVFTGSQASSGIGSAVTYATSSAYTPTSTGTYTVTTSASGFDPTDFIQYIYSPSLNPSTAATALKGAQYGFFADNTAASTANASNSGSYNVSLTGGSAYQFVNAGYYSNNATYPQVPGNGFYSEGTVNTTVLYNNPGSTSFIPDATPTTTQGVNTPGKVSQTLNVTSANYTTAFNSITIDGLTHPTLGDLTAILSHDGVSVDLFDHTGAVGPTDPNQGQGSQAMFDGNNYTFSLLGTSLAGVPDFTNAPDGVTYAAAGNAVDGFDKADAGNTLNSFDGVLLGGGWTLTLEDSQPDDVGSFTGFSFGVNSAPVPETSTGISFGLLLGLVGLGRAGQLVLARRRTAAASSV